MALGGDSGGHFRARHRLRQNPRHATLGLNCLSAGVMLRVDGVTPVASGSTARVLECAAHRTRDRDVHAAATGSVVGRRVVGQYPYRRADSNDTNGNADRYQHGAAFAGRGRLGRWGLAFVDRRRAPSCGELDRSTVNGSKPGRPIFRTLRLWLLRIGLRRSAWRPCRRFEGRSAVIILRSEDGRWTAFSPDTRMLPTLGLSLSFRVCP